MLKKIRLIVTIIVALFLTSALMGVFGVGPDMNLGFIERLMMLVFAIIIGMVLYVIIYYWWGNEHKCPSCNKRFCLKKEGTQIQSKESISVLVETKTRNNDGDVTGTAEQYVPGERITYQVNYVCKKCGKKCHSTYRKDVPSV